MKPRQAFDAEREEAAALVERLWDEAERRSEEP